MPDARAFATSAVISSSSHSCSSAGDNTHLRFRITEKPTSSFRNSTPSIKCSSLNSPAGILTSFHHLREQKTMCCHMACPVTLPMTLAAKSPMAHRKSCFTLPPAVLLLVLQWSTCQALSYPTLFSQYVMGQFVLFLIIENLSKHRISGSFISAANVAHSFGP